MGMVEWIAYDIAKAGGKCMGGMRDRMVASHFAGHLVEHDAVRKPDEIELRRALGQELDL